MSRTLEVAHPAGRAARRVFCTLTVTRWFPVGLIVGLVTLWPLERGLTVAEALLASSFTGFAVVLLELPTSGFADAFGRRPVYLTAAVAQVASAVTLLLAHSFWMFAAAAVLTGVFRALDSGPLEAWFVDAVHEHEPDADVAGTLALGGTLLGLSIAAGALLSGLLVWWHPIASRSALFGPVALYGALTVVHLVMTAALVREPSQPPSWRRARESVRQTPRVIGAGVGLLRTDRVLRGLILVELFAALAMVVFESFLPIRMAELVGGEERAGAVVGPVASAGWAVFAGGAALGGLLQRRIGSARVAMLARAVNGVGAVLMGLVVGPAALVAAYLFTYSQHGMGSPAYAALLHRQASRHNRATVLSIASMMMFLGYSVAAPVMGRLSDGSSTQLAMVAAGSVSILGVLCFLPALRAERSRRGEPAGG